MSRATVPSGSGSQERLPMEPSWRPAPLSPKPKPSLPRLPHATRVGRDPRSVKKVARLNTCIAPDGSVARVAVRPLVARYLGAGRLRSKTVKEQGLELPAEALQSVAGSPYSGGVTPYLSLLPLITDRHVNALTLAGNIEEVTEHVVLLFRAGIDEIIIRPFAPEGGTIEETIASFASRVWPQAMS